MCVCANLMSLLCNVIACDSFRWVHRWWRWRPLSQTNTIIIYYAVSASAAYFMRHTRPRHATRHVNAPKNARHARMHRTHLYFVAHNIYVGAFEYVRAVLERYAIRKRQLGRRTAVSGNLPRRSRLALH